jgi:hypothetical protein
VRHLDCNGYRGPKGSRSQGQGYLESGSKSTLCTWIHQIPYRFLQHTQRRRHHSTCLQWDLQQPQQHLMEGNMLPYANLDTILRASFPHTRMDDSNLGEFILNFLLHIACFVSLLPLWTSHSTGGLMKRSRSLLGKPSSCGNHDGPTVQGESIHCCTRWAIYALC